MKSTSLQYSLKVWLGSVFVAPVIYIIFLTLSGGDTFDFVFYIYFYFALASLAFSFLTWLMFWAITALVINRVTNPLKRRMVLFVSGIFLTVATFTIFSFSFFDSFIMDDMFVVALLCFCLCIAAGSWYFKLDC